MRIYSKKDLNEYHQSLTYDDISLIPTEVSRIKSRTEASTNCKFLGIELGVPIVSSPMDTVTGLEMVDELNQLGCLGILNRFDSSLDSILKGNGDSKKIKAISVALTISTNDVEKLFERGYIICIDTANANNKEVLRKTEEIKKKFDVRIIIGNIAHGGSLKQLEDAGADAVRVRSEEHTSELQ